MQIKKNLIIGTTVVLLVALILLWMRWGPDSWDVQITGVTGDGRDIQYRIETVYTGTAETLIFMNKDAGIGPPYFKFDSADLQALASRISRDCSDETVTVRQFLTFALTAQSRLSIVQSGHIVSPDEVPGIYLTQVPCAKQAKHSCPHMA